MRIMIYVLANRDTGLGHWYRCLALKDEALRLGHQVRLVSDKEERASSAQSNLRVDGYPNGPRLCYLLETWQPDWVIFDLKMGVPTYVKGMLNSYGVRAVTLNGVGYDPVGSLDLHWAQDDPERIILRREIRGLSWGSGERWLVFGGSTDAMGLLPAFCRVNRERAWLVGSDLLPGLSFPKLASQELINPGSGLLKYLGSCKRACVAAGMISWELAYLGVPQHVLSSSSGHLAFATRLQAMGLAAVWGGVGVPGDQELREFLCRPAPMPKSGRPDGRGAERLLSAMQKAM